MTQIHTHSRRRRLLFTPEVNCSCKFITKSPRSIWRLTPNGNGFVGRGFVFWTHWPAPHSWPDLTTICKAQTQTDNGAAWKDTKTRTREVTNKCAVHSGDTAVHQTTAGLQAVVSSLSSNSSLLTTNNASLRILKENKYLWYATNI